MVWDLECFPVMVQLGKNGNIMIVFCLLYPRALEVKQYDFCDCMPFRINNLVT